MAKSVFKEIIIFLLLCLAIILLLGILLYEYIPMSKTVPNPVSYVTPAEVQEELAAMDDINEDQIIMTYEVDSTDLNNYRRVNDYQPGKANPFAPAQTTTGNNETSGNSNNQNGGQTTNNNNSNNNNNANNPNAETTSGETFYPETGTK